MERIEDSHDIAKGFMSISIVLNLCSFVSRFILQKIRSLGEEGELRPTGEVEIVSRISSCCKGGLRSVTHLFRFHSYITAWLPFLVHIKSCNGYMYLLCSEKCER